MHLLLAEAQIVKFLRLRHFQFVKVVKKWMKLVTRAFQNIYQAIMIKKE